MIDRLPGITLLLTGVAAIGGQFENHIERLDSNGENRIATGVAPPKEALARHAAAGKIYGPTATRRGNPE